MNHIAVIDVETTGFKPINNDVITLGIDILNDKLQSIDEFYIKLRPEIMSWMNDNNVATDVHGFTLSDMAFFPERRDSLVTLLNFLKKYKNENNSPIDMWFHAQGRFDYFFLEWCFRKEELQYSMWKVFDMETSYSTIKLANKLGYSDNSLKEWAKKLGIKFNHHNALSDAKMCSSVLKYLCDNNFNGNYKNLVEFINRKEEKKSETKKVQKVQQDESLRSLF